MAKNKQAPAPPLHRPASVSSLLAAAVQAMQRGMVWQARAQCQQILKTAPGQADAHYLLGIMAARAGNFEEAARQLAESLKSNPANPGAHNNLGVALKKLDRLAEAEPSFQAAIALKPDYAEAHHNLGNTLRSLGRLDEALASLEQAIALRPDLAEAHHGRGNVLVGLDRAEEAIASFDKAIALRSAYGDALNDRGNALASLRRFPEAIECFTRAIAADSSSARAYANRGGALMEIGRPEEAIPDLDKAIALDPRYLEAYENRAQAAASAKRHAEAADFYRRLHEIDPSYPFVKGNLLHARMLCCDWDGIDSLYESIESDLAAGLPAAEPFGFQGIGQSEASLLACASIFAAREYPAAEADAQAAATAVDGRITIGYLCGEFRQHATSILMCGVYEHHDRQHFRLIAFDNGGGDGSDYRKRIEAAFDEMVDISMLGDAQAASLIRSKGVEILVNLNGYYGQERTGIFAHRASPIQVNYLGFPGTMGAPYFDYLVADEVVIPAGSREFYTEKVVYLPGCYQANDSKRPIADRPFERAPFGLPAGAFVFCCFNNNYKITPATFDSWMRIMRRVEGSCLWLLENNPAAAANLRQAAQDRGVDAGRLVFARHLPPDEHLARHALADLFLDTLPYNAHTTASDALWAGLPFLTRTGTTFAGRVATSMLRAMGMAELVTATDEEYEEAAVRLATQPAALAALRAKLLANRDRSLLYDTAQFTRNLEAAYRTMRSRHVAGETPAHFRVEDSRPG